MRYPAGISDSVFTVECRCEEFTMNVKRISVYLQRIILCTGEIYIILNKIKRKFSTKGRATSGGNWTRV